MTNVKAWRERYNRGECHESDIPVLLDRVEVLEAVTPPCKTGHLCACCLKMKEIMCPSS